MPDRAIIPLLPAIALGFIGGIVSSALLLEDGATLAVGVAGVIATAFFATSSVFGVKGEAGEKTIVAVLRVACAIGLFACIYLFMLGFLREGSAMALVWVPLAILFGLLLSRMRVRPRDEQQGSEETA